MEGDEIDYRGKGIQTQNNLYSNNNNTHDERLIKGATD